MLFPFLLMEYHNIIGPCRELFSAKICFQSIFENRKFFWRFTSHFMAADFDFGKYPFEPKHDDHVGTLYELRGDGEECSKRKSPANLGRLSSGFQANSLRFSDRYLVASGRFPPVQ